MKTALFLLSIFFVQGLFAQYADTTRIKQHLKRICLIEGYRNHENPSAMARTAGYIYKQMDRYADTTYFETFRVNGQTYKNVVCVIGKDREETVVIGAHYDVYGESEGADDNASGVVGLLELTKLMARKEIPYRLEIVAYALEEPPYFRTQNMGSYKHVESLQKRNIKVKGMICLEMIGYFDEAENSQDYPVKFMKLAKGTKANYITVVNKTGNGKFTKKFTKTYCKVANLPAKKVKAPTSVQGIDFSDHLNYWNAGMDALMITDTAFYRNGHYHTENDTISTLNLPKMALVIDGVVDTLLSL